VLCVQHKDISNFASPIIEVYRIRLSKEENPMFKREIKIEKMVGVLHSMNKVFLTVENVPSRV